MSRRGLTRARGIVPEIVRRRHLNDFDRFPRALVPAIEMLQQIFESNQVLSAFVDDRERLPVIVEYHVTYGL